MYVILRRKEKKDMIERVNKKDIEEQILLTIKVGQIKGQEAAYDKG